MTHPDLTIHTGRTDSPRFSSRTARSHSISSDRPSTSGYSIPLSPPHTSPYAAFIAPSAASQIVTNETDKLADAWADQNGLLPSGETALVAMPAMRLVNNFLDQLLFSFLSHARSTSLAQLRPAVSEVLKPRLAREAIQGAERELEEYLGGGQDEDLLAFGSGPESVRDWDLELSWKRTRLRCMVYSSLGDMEEDDEEYYTEQEDLGPSEMDDEGLELGVVSPAVAIFLTSILEFMGEQVLMVAGHAAYQRLRLRHEREHREGTGAGMPADFAERIVVDDCDVERVALDRTLGRLWRGWKKRIRSPAGSITSFGRFVAAADDQDGEPIPSVASVLAEDEFAARIPLPVSKDDVREIEVPGLVAHSDDEEENLEDAPTSTRPKSLMIFSHPIQGPPTPAPTQPSSPVVVIPKSRKRSRSLPSPVTASLPMFSRLNKSRGEKAIEPETVYTCEADAPMSQVESREASESVGQPSTHEQHRPVLDTGRVTGVLARAAAIGAATTAGVVAVAKGEAPQMAPEDREASDHDEDLIEEPQIMTSSRISIGGRISPDDRSRPASIRAPSVHSLRLIEVANGARSPTIKSPTSPVDGHDIVTRVLSISRSNSLRSPVASPDPQTPRLAAPVARNASPLAHSSSAVSSTAASVSEDDRPTSDMNFMKPARSVSPAISAVSEEPHARMSVVPADLAAAMQGVDMDPSPTSQHYVPLPLDKDMSEEDEFTTPPPKHPGRDDASRRVSPVRATEPPLTPPQETSEAVYELPTKTSPKPRNIRHEEGSLVDAFPHVAAATVPRGQLNGDVAKATDQRQARAQIAQPRSSPPRPSRDEVVRKAGPEPAPKRSIHTSSSSTSSHSHKLKPLRTSEDSVPSNPEHPGHTFEDLIRSDQTLQYTLTPQNMRNIESPDKIRNAAIAANVLDRPVTGRSRNSSLNKFSGLSSNPLLPATDARSPISAKSPKAANTVAPKTGSRVRTNAPQARDARPDRDSMGDFAEFIRSTGPAKSKDTAPRAASASMPNNRRASVSRGTSFSSPRMSAILPKRTNPSGASKKLEARDAVVNHDSITDLIDFVRAGPKNADDHRIPRTVAPFRTTMDSDQLSSVVGGRAVDASLPDARYSQLSTNPSVQSTTSQTPLISTSRPPKPAPKSLPNRNTFGGEADMMPKRKTRRVRDPYAIDFSDEEDEMAKEASEEEESLADFLRNAMPPPDPESVPVTSVFDSVSKPKKKSGFFGRAAAPPMPPPKASSTLKSVVPQPSPQPKAPSTSHPPSHGNYLSQLDSARHPTGSIGSRGNQQPYQAREALSVKTQTSDLADFLRSSEPPADSGPRILAINETDPKKTPFGSMFSRRKKAVN